MPPELHRSCTPAYSSSVPVLASIGCRHAPLRRPLGLDLSLLLLSLRAPASREPLAQRARTLLKLAELARAQARRGAAARLAAGDGKGAQRPQRSILPPYAQRFAEDLGFSSNMMKHGCAAHNP